MENKLYKRAELGANRLGFSASQSVSLPVRPALDALLVRFILCGLCEIQRQASESALLVIAFPLCVVI